MTRKIAKLASIALGLVALASVSTASYLWWHNPVPAELLKK